MPGDSDSRALNLKVADIYDNLRATVLTESTCQLSCKEGLYFTIPAQKVYDQYMKNYSAVTPPFSPSFSSQACIGSGQSSRSCLALQVKHQQHMHVNFQSLWLGFHRLSEMLVMWLSMFIILTLDGGEMSASWLSRLVPGEKAPSTHWTEDCVGPGAILDTLEEKVSLPYQELNHDSSAVRPLA
jgi:hypothetical protein